jgi:hypothetical protein
MPPHSLKGRLKTLSIPCGSIRGERVHTEGLEYSKYKFAPMYASTFIHWIHEWFHLLPELQRAHIDSGCSQLETVARAIYNQGD